MAEGTTFDHPLSRRIVDGAAWVVGMRFLVRCLGAISIVILARLLTPADFGLMALSALLLGGLETLTAFSFEVWLIRHPNPQRAHYDTVWTLNVARGWLLAALLALAAEPAAQFFNEPRLTWVVYAVAGAMALKSFTNVGIVDFQKHLHFDRDFLYLLAGRLSGFCVTVGLAFALKSYWALVAGIVAQRVVELVASYVLHSYRPSFELSKVREVFDFTKWLLVNNLVGYAYVRADTFIIGKLLSSQMLGLYTLAREIASLASTEIVTPLRRVLLPAYAQMQDDRDQIANGFVQGFGIILLLGLPLTCGIGLLADPLVRLMLGEQWLDSIPLIEVLAVYGITAVAMANQGPALLAVGRPRLLSSLYIVGLLILIPMCWIGTERYGLLGTAWAIAIANLIVLLLSLTVTCHALSVPVTRLLAVSWRAVFATAAMTAGLIVLLQVLDDTHWFVILAIAGSLGAAIYAGTAWLLWKLTGSGPGPERILIDAIRDRVRARSA